ncbi:MAG: hypothetical protein PHT19_12990 [Methylococcus sp.]|nr:hypothetical protein [Methylococcus sp.]
MTTLSLEINDRTRSALDALADIQVAIDALLAWQVDFHVDDRRCAEYLTLSGVESARVLDCLDRRCQQHAHSDFFRVAVRDLDRVLSPYSKTGSLSAVGGTQARS